MDLLDLKADEVWVLKEIYHSKSAKITLSDLQNAKSLIRMTDWQVEYLLSSLEEKGFVLDCSDFEEEKTVYICQKLGDLIGKNTL